MFLKKARQNAENIISEIDRLAKESSSLTKKEAANSGDTVVAYIDGSMEAINEESKEMLRNLKKHRNQAMSRIRFLKRHYRRI
ncbi:MAG: hypothetical protein HYW27_00775 [Candidatus Aenigmarchaeota archaeon]|nr:hypothetical protein [Candidatus Aenigmarchaeota archaeon]